MRRHQIRHRHVHERLVVVRGLASRQLQRAIEEEQTPVRRRRKDLDQLFAALLRVHAFETKRRGHGQVVFGLSGRMVGRKKMKQRAELDGSQNWVVETLGTFENLNFEAW